MTTANQFQAARLASTKFAEHLHALRTQCRSFAACVRLEYPGIEQAISDGVPLEAIVQALSESYGVQGSLAALKSALSRIRRALDGQVCQQWLDNTTSMGLGGMPHESNAKAPMMNPHMQPGFRPQPNVPFAEPVRQQFPGAGPSMLERGSFQPPVQNPGWQAPFPRHGQGPQWQSSFTGYNPYGDN